MDKEVMYALAHLPGSNPSTVNLQAAKNPQYHLSFKRKSSMTGNVYLSLFLGGVHARSYRVLTWGRKMRGCTEEGEGWLKGRAQREGVKT
jgi:hypothetical protein